MKKTLGFRDIVLMNIVAIVGLRWIPVAAGFGASAVSFWLLAAFAFFVPLGWVSAELATTFPEQGGLYLWVRNAFGDRWAFLTSWYYWINNVFYYPSLLTFVAVTAAYLIDPALARSKLYVCTVILVIFWSITLINMRGMSAGKWLINLGGLFGTLIPGAIMISLGFLSWLVWKRPVPTDYSLASLLPQVSGLKNISFLSTLMFAMAGMEVTPILAGETKDPRRTLPRATLVSAILIAGIYIIGTISMTLIIAPSRIDPDSGIMEALLLLTQELDLGFLVPVMAALILVGSFGGISVWVVGPIKMLFECTQKGILPSGLTELNRNGMPANAMLLQAGLISVVVLVISFLPTVKTAYEALVMMTTITYFIPYLFMFVAFLVLRVRAPDLERPCRVPGGTVGAWLSGLLGVVSVTMALVLPFFPTGSEMTASDLFFYRLQIGGGPLLFGIIGLVLFARRGPECSVRWDGGPA